MNNFEMLDNTKESRCKASEAKYHAHALNDALEVFYWTGKAYHYQEAIKQFEELACEMAKLQKLFKKGVNK